MKNKTFSVAVVGATGMVGREVLNILESRKWCDSKSLRLFASKNSIHEVINFRGEDVSISELSSSDQIEADIVFFGAGATVSKLMAKKVLARGSIVIDKSSAFRDDKDSLLIVPEVNGHLLDKEERKLIACPNCVVAPLVQVLHPIKKLFGLSQVVVSTYQAVSGAGKSGTDELESQVRDLFNMREISTDVFKKRIAFNVLPFIPSDYQEDAEKKTEEERKIIEETKKILEIPELLMEATSVRVPVFNGHSLSVNVATQKPVDFLYLRDTLKNSPSIMVMDDPEKRIYPTPIEASGEDVTLVGRIRPNTGAKNGVSLWISSDNLRTGAALNAVRIAEKFVKRMLEA